MVIRHGNPGTLFLLIAALVLLSGCRTLSTGLFETGRHAMRALGGFENGVVTVDDHQIGYLRRAGSGPPLILLHGFASEKDVWLRFLRGIPNEVDVIALDLPGHGDSTRDPAFQYDIASMVEQIAAAIDALTDRPLNLAGTSLGGMIATFYAAGHPDRVITLTLYAPAGVYPPHPSEFQQALQNGQNPLIATTRDEFDELIDIVFYDPPAMPWPIGAALRTLAVSRAAFNTKIWNDLWPGHPTLDASLPRLEMPVLLVWGREDAVLDVSSVAVFERLVPNLDVTIVDRAGHAIINERPREMARLHRQFVQRQPCTGEPPARVGPCLTLTRQGQSGQVSDE